MPIAAAPCGAQGVPYLLAEPSKDMADARLQRCPLSDHTAEVMRRLALFRHMREPVQAAAAGLLQSAWRQFSGRSALRREEAAAAIAAARAAVDYAHPGGVSEALGV
jgi:hypothetical protein